MDQAELQFFAEALRVGRARLKLGKVAFCKKAGISPNTLRALERGEQQPEPSTVVKVARALGTTAGALTHGKRAAAEASDPLLKHLNDEDLEVAQAFHHAPVRVRQEVLGVLQQAHTRRSTHVLPRDAMVWGEALLELTPGQRGAIADLIQEFKTGATLQAPTTAPGEAPGRESKKVIPQRKLGS